MGIEGIRTEKAPAPIGPYSQAVRAGDFVFCSGQVALDPTTGQLTEGGAGPQAEVALGLIAHEPGILPQGGAGRQLLGRTGAP